MSKATNQIPGEWARLEMSERAGAVRFSVHVRPRSSRCSILGVREGALDVALTAPPAEGAANEELRKLLSRVLEVRRADVNILVGASSRSKLLEINGTSSTTVRELFSRAKR
ncbi:DUF167 domain-containing protein [Polyangium fumosum]|uniref:UPF0235 protein E8A74_47605 n=1 Tax=Polyangium fumosum TaxID=889272 RepID=A0A4U1IMI9_9BACT|nr:DUF167 domain-containing protein [Polyangium fumosum]TKC95171.1 DUF167 domain-containing protein [Polyangium fumosum]